MKKIATVLMLSAVSVFAEPQVSKVSFFAIGDVLMHTPLFAKCEVNISDCVFDQFFAAWKKDIESVDYACVNQETVFVPRGDGYTSYPTFGSPEEVGSAEINAGFDIVTHATNHTMDRKAKAVDYTLDFWKGKPMMVLGIHGTAEDQEKIRYDEKNGIKFAFLNFTYGLNGQKMPDNRQYLVDMLDSEGKWLKQIAEADRNRPAFTASPLRKRAEKPFPGFRHVRGPARFRRHRVLSHSAAVSDAPVGRDPSSSGPECRTMSAVKVCRRSPVLKRAAV